MPQHTDAAWERAQGDLYDSIAHGMPETLTITVHGPPTSHKEGPTRGIINLLKSKGYNVISRSESAPRTNEIYACRQRGALPEDTQLW